MIEVEMNSLEIAELVGKRHDNVVRDIRTKLLPEISLLKNEESDFIVNTSTYTNSRNKEYEMFILNKNATNALVANYKMNHAIKVIQHIIHLEKELERKEKELSIMKDIVWDVVNGQKWVSQEQALKMAGVKHPRLFMKYLKGHQTWMNDLVFNRQYLMERQCNKHGDRWWKFSQEGFRWLLDFKSDINAWVEKQKVLEKERKVIPA